MASVVVSSGRDYIIHDDSGNVTILEAATTIEVTSIATEFDPPLDQSVFTDSTFGEVLFLRRLEVDTDANTLDDTRIDTGLNTNLLGRGLTANNLQFSFDKLPNWGTLFTNEASEGDSQTGNLNSVRVTDTFSRTDQFYVVVSRDDALPDEFTGNPGLYRDAGGGDPAFQSLEAWSTTVNLSFTAFDDLGSAVSTSFAFTADVEDAAGATQIGVDSGAGDADAGLISAGDTAGASEELQISYDGRADLIWAEIDLDEFATQTSLESGLYEIAEVTLLHDGAVIATYLVGDGAADDRPTFAIDTNNTSSGQDDRFDPRWIEASADGRFVVGGFDFNEIRLSAFGYGDQNPFDDTDNPVDAGGARAGFAVNSISYLRSEDLATGLAPSVSLSYSGWVSGGTDNNEVTRADTESPETVIDIALSERAVLTPAPLPSTALPTDEATPADPAPDPDPAPDNNTPIAPAAADPLVTFETVRVTVNDSGDGTVEKLNEGVADQITSVEDFVAAEADGQRDSITLTTAVDPTIADAISGLSDDAVGTFIANDDPTSIAFGPSEAVQLSDLLALNQPGTYQITDGDESGQIGNISFSNFEEINFDVLCFAKGMRIDTERGPQRVEDLNPGDRVWTLDHGFQPIIWHGMTHRPAWGAAAPIMFEPGVLGNTRPLIVSRQHRILLEGYQSELLFGEPEVLAAAHLLEDGNRIHTIHGGVVEYHHILLERHGILRSEGVLSESYFPGNTSWDVLSAVDRSDIGGLFPEIDRKGPAAYGDLCRMALKKHEVKLLLDLETA